MPTLYVENVPAEIYAALRARARKRRTSISSEVLALLKAEIPAAAELARRREALARALRIGARKSPARGPFPSAEEMLREDRLR